MNTIIGSNYVNNLQGKAKNDLINEILDKASAYLKGSQLMDLNRTLNECTEKYEIFVDISLNNNENYNETNDSIVNVFLNTKKLEGASPRTINYYKGQLVKLIEWADCPISDIDTEKIREYLVYYQNLRNCSNATVDNNRRIFSTFFSFCLDEGFVQVNPMRRVKKIKSAKIIKKPFTDFEIETMRDYLSQMSENTDYDTLIKFRDRALFELLLSSGIRVNECVNLNKNDLDLENNTFKVFGKGAKERICYFSSKAKFYLIKLFEMESKTEKYDFGKEGPLFINYKRKNRLQINSVERRIRTMGRELSIEAHPHKFRRTFATNLIRKEVPIEQVKEMMGHANMDTTMIYTVLDQDQIKLNHNRYSG